jgi:hypothetical protein
MRSWSLAQVSEAQNEPYPFRRKQKNWTNIGTVRRGCCVRAFTDGGGMSADPFYTYGPPELCVWKVAPSTFWFQTTNPRYSRKLDQRQDTRRIAITGVNHYRRTYEMRGTWRKVRRIVNRYLMPTGDTFFGTGLRQDTPKLAPRVRTAANRKRAELREVAGRC